MAYDALVFDIDGTLWDASVAIAKGWNRALASLGLERTVSPEQVKMVSGNPYQRCVDILLPGLKRSHAGLLQALYHCETEAVKTEGGRFYDGVIEGITTLVEKNRVLLVSNCEGWYLSLFLEQSGLSPVLTGFDCHGISGLAKSDMLSRMKDRYSLDNPVYVGDTENDERAAGLAGYDFIFARWGFGNPAGTPEAFGSFKEMLDHLKKRHNGSH